MNETNYVSHDSLELAKSWEGRFQVLPPDAEIYFISITPVPAPKGKSTVFDVRLGISRRFEESTGLAIIKRILQDEIASGEFNIRASVYRGVLGACRNGDSSAAHPSQA